MGAGNHGCECALVGPPASLNFFDQSRDLVSVSEISTTTETAAVKGENWRMFLAIAAVAHGVTLFCPPIIVPPRITNQIPTVGVALVVLAIPFVTSLFLLFCYRTLSERVIAWGSLAVSLLWLALAGSLVEQVLKRP
jgi:Na+/melibiose symporter-like transporter